LTEKIQDFLTSFQEAREPCVWERLWLIWGGNKAEYQTE